MKLGIRAKLFLLSLSLIAVSLIAAAAYLSSALENTLTKYILDDLLVRLDLVDQGAAGVAAPLTDFGAWDDFADRMGRLAQARVTVVRSDGVVLGDTDVSLEQLPRMENHSDRPEVREALSKGLGETTRYSATVKGRMLYAAVPLRRGNQAVAVVRLALPLVEIDRSIAELRRLLAAAGLFAIVVAIFLSGFATQLVSRNVRALTSAANRMAGGDLSTHVIVAGRDEFAELGHALNQLAQSLSQSLADLRSERDLLEGILAGMREGVLLIDAEGKFALSNPAFREMFLVGSDAVGRPLLEVVRHAELKALLDRAADSSVPVPGEIETAGLKPRRLMVHASSAGPERGTLLVFVDVTEIRRLETLRRDFVANVSHELRTPVASARSALETLRGAMKNDPAAAEEFLDIVSRNVERFHSLIEDLLNLSRIESREFKLALEPLILDSAIGDVLQLFRERAAKKLIKLIPALPGDLPASRADRRAVEQILANLVDNAIKYCPPKSEVRIKAAVDGTFIRVSVEDTGPGIEPQHLSRLFERFYRVDAGRSRELGGTGLGLSIVKRLVEAMGGTVGVDSTPGRGSTFSFTLPRF